MSEDENWQAAEDYRAHQLLAELVERVEQAQQREKKLWDALWFYREWAGHDLVDGEHRHPGEPSRCPGCVAEIHPRVERIGTMNGVFTSWAFWFGAGWGFSVGALLVWHFLARPMARLLGFEKTGDSALAAHQQGVEGG